MLKGVKKRGKQTYKQHSRQQLAISLLNKRQHSLFDERTIVVPDLLATFSHNTQIFTVFAKCGSCITYSGRQPELSQDPAVSVLRAVHQPLLWPRELLFFCSAFCSLPGGHRVHRLRCLRKPSETNGLATRTLFRKMGEADLKICRQRETSNSGLPCSGYLLMLFSRQLYKEAVTPHFSKFKRSEEGTALGKALDRVSKGRFSFTLSNAARHSFSAFCTSQLSGACSELLAVLVLMIPSVRHQTFFRHHPSNKSIQCRVWMPP